MTQELFGAALDSVYLLWWWVPGIVLVRVMGFRNAVDQLALGLILSAAISSVIYVGAFSLGSSELSLPITRGVFLALIVLGIIFLRRDLRSVLLASFIAGGISVVSVTLRNLLRLDGWMGDTDHLITLWVAEIIEASDEGPIFSHSATQKKGLIFPLLLGLGRSGLFLGAMPVVIFIVLLLATARLVHIATNQRWSTPLTVGFFLILLMWLSSPMFVGLSTYAHGHAIASLAVAVAVRFVVAGASSPIGTASTRAHLSESGWAIAIAISAASFVLAQTRIEAFLLALLISLPILWRERAISPRPDYLQRLTVALGGPIGFALWFAGVGSFPLGSINPGLFYAVLFGGTVIVTTVLFLWPGLRNVLMVGIPTVMISGLFFYLLPIGGSRNNLYYLWLNLFEGAGYWGYVWWVITILLVVFTLSPAKTSRERLLLWLTFVAILFTVLVKAFDGSLDRWGSIRDGWSDSVNRTIFHAYSMVTAVAVLLVSRLIGKNQNSVGRVTEKQQK